MNHPTQQDWIAYVYGETAPEERDRMTAHTLECPDCRRLVETWQETMNRLDDWKLPDQRRHAVTWTPVLKWALAASLLLGIGLTIDRWSSSAPVDMAKAKAELLPVLRQELRTEMTNALDLAVKDARAEVLTQVRHEYEQRLDNALAALAASSSAETRGLLASSAQALAAAQEQDRQTFLQAVSRLESQRKADLAWLRRDLETVAVFTDARLANAREEIGQLASIARPSPSSRSD